MWGFRSLRVWSAPGLPPYQPALAAGTKNCAVRSSERVARHGTLAALKDGRKILIDKSSGPTAIQESQLHLNLPATPTPSFPGEPDAPHISQLPGPSFSKLIAELDQYQDPRAIQFFSDTNKSIGNYVADSDGNLFLDVFCHIASLSVGYNNPALLKAAGSAEWARAIVNRPALGLIPPTEFPDLLKQSVMKCAPKGLHQVFTAACGTCANENAMKAACMYFMSKTRNGGPFLPSELESCMSNQLPGSPDLAVLSFEGAFHGRLFGSLSTTCSRPMHKVDLPAFHDWPHAPFPKLRYPETEEANRVWNAREEERCIKEFEHILTYHTTPIVAVIIEPIQSEGGHNEASAGFYRAIRRMCGERDIMFICDEVQTGVGATGVWWAHEHWGLEQPPDMVTFSKKMQIAGFYHNMPLRPNQPLRNFGTWMGDPLRLLQLRSLIEEIEKNKLVQNARITGDYLKSLLHVLERAYPELISKVRGRGTFLGFDMPTTREQALLLALLRERGIVAGGCGATGIRLRPMLWFQPRHALQFAERLEDSLRVLPAYA